MNRMAFLLMLLAVTTWAAEPVTDGGAPVKRGRSIAQVKLLYFHASWCPSCKRLDAGRVLERLHELEPALVIDRVDVDTQVPLLDRYGVTQTPTLLLVDADGFPLGKVAIDLDRPDETLGRAQRLVKKMVK